MAPQPSAPLRPDPSVVLGFGGIVLIGGLNFVAVRFSNFELPPFWGAAVRFGAASLVFVAIALARRATFPRERALLGAMLYGALAFGLSYACAYYGLVHLQAGFAAVVLATVPLGTILLASLQGLERFRGQALAGALVAVAGILLVAWPQLSGRVRLLPVLALLAAALSIAQASIVAKRLPRVDPFALNAIGMAVGAALLYLLSEATREVHVIPARDATWTALVYLILVGSIALFALYLFVLRRWTATGTAYQFVLAPIVAITAGNLLAGETVTPLFLAGALIVALGVYLGALHRTAPNATGARQATGAATPPR